MSELEPVLQLPILEGDKVVYISIPRMSEFSFGFFKDLLVQYERAIVLPDAPDPDQEKRR